jgi:hypothetical protein
MSDNPTQPLPTLRPDDVIYTQPKPRTRHRGVVALIVIVIVLILIAVGLVAADNYAKSYATGYVRDKVASALGLKSTAPVHVGLGTGSFLLQLLNGSIDSAQVDVAPLTVDGVTGSALVTAGGVPLDSNKPVNTMEIAVTVPASSIQSQLEKALPQLKQVGAKFTIGDNRLNVAMKFTVLGISVPVSATVIPGVKNGGPTFTLDTVTIAGQKTSAAALDKVFPGFLGALKSGQSLCVANLLPREFTLKDVQVLDKSITYEFSGDGAKLNGAALAKKGTCPTS